MSYIALPTEAASLRKPRRRAFAISVVCLSLVIAATLSLHTFGVDAHRELLGLGPAAASARPNCNPHLEPGRLEWDRDGDNWRTRWRLFGDRCPEAPDWLSLLRDAADPVESDVRSSARLRLQWLRNKTIMLIGGALARFGWH